MSVQERALAWARSQVGKSGRRYSDSVIWGALYPKGAGWAWCAAFVVEAYRQAGVDLRKAHSWPYYCPYLESWAKRIGAWKTTGGNAGDLVLYDWGGDGVADHVGISWPDPGSSLYRAVEGNTSSGSAGSQSNGGGVWIRYRKRGTIRGWVDMATVLRHVGASASASASAPAVVARNHTDGALLLAEDGSLGPATIARWQEVMGTPIDGVISRPSHLVSFTQVMLNLYVAPEHQHTVNTQGQLTVDGLLGPATWRVFQILLWNWCDKYRGGRTVAQYCDGDPGPLTIKALQWCLNNSWAGAGALLKKG